MFHVDVAARDLATALNGGRLFKITAVAYTGLSSKPFRVTVEIIGDAPGAENWRPDVNENPQD